MTRTLTVLVLGVLLGVGTTLLLMPDRSAPIKQIGLRSTDFAQLIRQLRLPRPRPRPTAFIAAVADAGAATRCEDGAVATEPPSTDRELALAVLLKRYAGIDAPRAALLAREGRARGMALESVYSTWARTEPAAALVALDAVDDPDDAAAVALALVVGLGNDAAALERVASRLAARDPGPPIASVVPPFGPGMAPLAGFASRSPLALMAGRWAQLDPSARWQ